MNAPFRRPLRAAAGEISRLGWIVLLAVTGLTHPLPSAGAADGPRTPDAARASFALDPGLVITLIAAEPLVRSPAALAWDEHGRLLVAENPDYPVGPAPGQAPAGALVHLADTNADGVADVRQVFADGLAYPNGLMPWKGGWLVTDAPHLWWLSDTNRDGRADVRELWFTGFATNQTTQLRACYPTLGPDGWIYVARGLAAGTVTSPRWPSLPAVDLKGGDFRFRPDGSAAETVGGNAQFGLVLDDVGRRFLVSNRNPLMHAVLLPRFWQRHPGLPFSDLVQDVSPTGYEARVHPRSPDTTTAGFMPEFMAAPHAGSFTAACGIHQYFGPGLGPGYPGSWFVCEPAQNLVQRQVATPAGPTFSSRRVPEDRDFLTSTDGWFRPVFCATAPDGSLVVADLYRQVIDHPDYLPENVRGKLDFDAGKQMGRLWRIRARDAALRGQPLASTSVEGLIASLSSSNLWVRQTAHRLLLEREPSIESLRALIEALAPDLPGPKPAPDGTPRWTDLPRESGDPAEGPHLGIARRLWLLGTTLLRPLAHPREMAELSNRGAQLLLQATFHPAATVRETTWRILLTRNPDPKHALPDVPYTLVAWWADDPSPAARFQFALACGDQQDDWEPVLPALAHMARLGADDRWTRAAVLSGLRGRESAFLDQLVHQPIPDTEGMSRLLHDFARLADASPNAASRRLLQMALDPAHASSLWPLSTLQGLSASLRQAGGKSLVAFLRDAPAANPEFSTLRDRLDAARHRIAHTVLQSDAPLPRRTASVEFLAEFDFDQTRDTLAAALAPVQPIELRLATARALGRFDQAEAGRLLAERRRWTEDPPSLRDAALAALISRPALVPALLDAVERGDAPAWIVDPQRRRQLQNHAQPAVRDRARRLFASVGGEDRLRVFEELKPVLSLPASGTRGRAVFTRVCANCHTLDGEGARVGPDLSGVRNQPAEALLLHIVVPDAQIYPGYQACEIETRDGRSLSGLLVSENPEVIVLRRAGGEEDTVRRAQLASITHSKLSLMPQELEKTMTRQELADLIARLRGLP